MKGISEAERRGKMLKEEQKQMKENVAVASKQVRKFAEIGTFCNIKN